MNQLELPSGWKLVRMLGRSPMSEVFLVEDPDGESRALKLLRPSVASDPRILERWRREAQLLAEISHPNLVRSHGTMKVANRPGLLLDYIEGPTLRDRLRVGKLEWEQVARIGVQVARALEKLHRHGAIHRDVKPHNIILHPRRGAVLADLGLVRREDDPELTRQGAALGSPAYMSPEQAFNPSETGPESDVFSLAATLHHALSGKPPFLGKGIGEVIHRVLHEDPEPLPEGVPELLVQVLGVGMAKDPEARYQRAFDFRQDLGRILTGGSPRLLTRQRRRRRMRLIGAVVGILVLVPGVVLLSRALKSGWPPADSSVESISANSNQVSPTDFVVTMNTEAAAGVPEFTKWLVPFEARVNADLGTGELSAAMAVVEELGMVALPPLVAEAFELQRHSAHTRLLELVTSRFEQLSRRAEELMASERQRYLLGIEQGGEQRNLAQWAIDVQRLWVARGIDQQVHDFYRPQGPLEKLRDSSRALAVLRTEAWSARAALAIPAKREQVAKCLRQTDLDGALAIWSRIEPQLFEFSSAARSEGLRLQLLQHLDGDLVSKASVSELEGMVAAEDDLGDWHLAQLMWYQGSKSAAAGLMESLIADDVAGDMMAAMWASEWAQYKTSAIVPMPDQLVPVKTLPAVVVDPEPLSEAETLALSWSRQVPEAEVKIVNQMVQVSWSAPQLGGSRSWEKSLGWERRYWEVAAWGMEWALPADVEPPRLVEVMGDISFSKASRYAVPRMVIGKLERVGVGIRSGARQSLLWQDGVLSLDGLKMGRLPAQNETRLRLEAHSISDFVPTRIWLQVRPR